MRVRARCLIDRTAQHPAAPFDALIHCALMAAAHANCPITDDGDFELTLWALKLVGRALDATKCGVTKLSISVYGWHATRRAAAGASSNRQFIAATLRTLLGRAEPDNGTVVRKGQSVR